MYSFPDEHYMSIPVEQPNIQKEAERLQYIWAFVAKNLGLSGDTIVELKHENNTPINQAKAMLKLVMKSKSMSTVKESLGRWTISDDQIKLIAKKLPAQCLNNLAEAVCLDASEFGAKSEPMRSLLIDMKTKGYLSGNSYSWNVINKFINKEKTASNDVSKTNSEDQNGQIRELKLDIALAAQREAALQFEVDNPKAENTLRAELDGIRKNIQNLQETLDSLVVLMQYNTPPAQNPEVKQPESNYNPRFHSLRTSY